MATLAVRDLGFSAGSARLLDGVSFEARAGQLIAIVGPNGAGKTTLLRSIAGLLRADGDVSIDGTALRTLSRRARARRIAFVAADDTTGDDLTVREVVTEGRFAHRRGALDRSPEHDDAVDDALARTELAGFAHRRLATLSSGERRRVWIALGLAQEADVVLLDEPTANLDIAHAQQTLRTIRALARAGRTVIVVLHDLNEAAQYADVVALVERTRLVAFGPPRDVLTDASLARAYGVPVEIATAGDGTLRIFARAS